MKNIRTAPQILEHYSEGQIWRVEKEQAIKAMRHYARVKSEKAYEKGYQMAINHLT